MTLDAAQLDELFASMKELDRDSLVRLILMATFHMRPSIDGFSFVASEDLNVGGVLFGNAAVAARAAEMLQA